MDHTPVFVDLTGHGPYPGQERIAAGPSPGPAPRRRSGPSRPPPGPVDTARFVLAGRPRPRVEDSVKIGELARVAALSRIGRTIGRDRIPESFSGRSAAGEPLRDDAHRHAFFLPEDADGDGEIDHLVIHVPAGIDPDCQQALDGLTRLWLEPRRHGGETAEAGAADERGREEWRLALEGFGERDAFSAASRLLAASAVWTSATPYLMPWHAKKGFGPAEQIARECRRRDMPRPAEIALLESIRIDGRERHPVHFRRFRSRGRLMQPDRLGTFVKITFAEPVHGPLALGFGCHFGLGLFRAAD